jgi:hypothetical protein
MGETQARRSIRSEIPAEGRPSDRAGDVTGRTGQIIVVEVVSDLVEEASAESSPASDPPAWSPVRAIGPPRRNPEGVGEITYQ